MHKPFHLLLWGGLLCCGAFQAGEMTEAQKRTEFAKAYASAKPEDRVAAVNLLKGCKEQVSMRFLSQVASTDVESPVRLAAFNVISEWDDPMGGLEPVILELYRNEKNRATRMGMLQAFTKLKTKTAAIEEAIKLLSQLVYPETFDNNNNNDNNNPNNNNNNGGGSTTSGRRRSKEEIDEMRKEYGEVLAVVNALTGQSISGGGNKVRDDLKKWWTLHKNDFAKADAEMLVKLKAEAQGASTKQAAETKKQ